MNQKLMKQNRLVAILTLMVCGSADLYGCKKCGILGRVCCCQINDDDEKENKESCFLQDGVYESINTYVRSYNLHESFARKHIDNIALVAALCPRMPLDLIFLTYETELEEDSKAFLAEWSPQLCEMLLDGQIRPRTLNLIKKIRFQYSTENEQIFIEKFKEFCSLLFPSVTTLSLRSNMLSKLGVDKLKNLIALVPNFVTTLGLEDNHLYKLGAVELSEVLSGLSPSVTTLWLEDNELFKLGADGLGMVLASISHKVTTLGLASNFLCQLGVDGLIRVIRSLSHSIKTLRIGGNHLLSLGISGLSRVLQSLNYTAVTALDFRSVDMLWQLQVNDLKVLIESVSDTVTTLDFRNSGLCLQVIDELKKMEWRKSLNLLF